MRWSFPLGRVFGIRIGVHATFVLILIWFGWLGWQHGGMNSAMWALALVLVLFTCVVLHELGHSVAAKFFGIEVHSITLLPIGGVAAMKAIPEEPHKELIIAVAGPMVNVVIVAVLVLAVGGMPGWADMPVLPGTVGELANHILLANIVLVIFNMIPAFPMDGGRVLRSMLASVIPYGSATAWATGIGQFLSVAFFVMGFWITPLLMIIAVFVFLGAESENRMVRMKDSLRDVHAGDIMMTDYAAVSPDDTLRICLDYYYRRRQEDFPVFVDGGMIGLLPRRIWQEALHRHGEKARVEDHMLRRFVSLHPDTVLASAFQDILAMNQGVYPVMEHGQMRGFITPEYVSRHLTFLQGARHRNRQFDHNDSKTERPSRFSIDLG